TSAESPKRSYLTSVMPERRELEQLPPLVGVHRGNIGAKDVNLRVWAHSSSSVDASSPASPASVSSASASSSPPHHKMESRRWSFKRVFFKKGAISPSKEVDHDEHACASNHAVAMLDERSHTEIKVFEDGSVESPRRSSILSSSSSTMKKRGKGQGRSALVSPAASPSRPAPSISPAKSGASGGVQIRRPMSPHAQHYQKQRIRAQELGRRAFLPYRHSLLIGACFSSRTPQVAF
ncbi:hypothetical protein GOP47_0028877, partial [Adiantum capillus-veneris]